MLHLSSKPQVLISLEPGLLVGRILRGVRVVKTQHASFGLSDWSTIWEGGLQVLDDPLSRIVARLGVAPGSVARVVFEKPGTLAEFQSIGARGHEASAAARLAAAERLSVSAASPCLAVRRLGRSKGEDGRALTQFIVAGVEEQDLQNVYHWVERANLRCRGVIPTSAMLLDAVASRLLGCRCGEPMNVLHIDRCRSVVASGSGDGISLLRTFEVGVTHLIEAVMRAARSAESARAGSLTVERAQSILMERGLPSAGVVFDEATGLDARAVLPHLQPVLQRISVELKQSFRRAMKGTPAGEMTIELSGPGASIEGLDAMIANALDVEVRRTDGAQAGLSAAESWADTAERHLLLHTLAEESERLGSVLRRSAIAGALIAGLVVGGEGVVQARSLAAINRAIAANAAPVEEVRDFRGLCERAATTEVSLKAARAVLGEMVGEQPDWSAAIREAALTAENRVTLTEVRADSDERQPALLISGLADAGNDGAALAGFIAAAQASPLVTNVEVISRRLIEIDSVTQHQFRLRIALARIPVYQFHAEASR